MCGPTNAKTSAKAEDEGASSSATEEKSETVQAEKSSPLDSYGIKISDFLNPSKPWILVPNGSFRGHFDWVPPNFRTGPWNIYCCMYLAALCYWIFLNCIDAFYVRPPPAQDIGINATNSWQHWYNVAGFFWSTYIAYKVVQSEMSWFAWTSYTLQSWTLIILRHGLSALAPYFPACAPYSEYLRFPMLLQATITFVIWNFALFPAILSQCKTPKARKGFLDMCFGFLLTQLHVVNIVLAGVSGTWGTPARELTSVDFAVALMFTLQYILFYLMILDRLGLHYYLIFSPRSPMALVWWSIYLGCIYGAFSMWNDTIQRYG